MEIYQLLKDDHKTVKTLLKKLEDTTERSQKERTTLFTKLKEALIPHTRAEEKIFYESLKLSEVKEADDLAYEGYEEHGVADRLIKELDKTEPSDKRWTALMSVLKEVVEHHIKEEEENMFKKAQKSFDSELAVEMGENFLELKEKFLNILQAGKIPKQAPSHSLSP
ncbi:hemerythrin domain-containing protein [Peredibacter starrii]|uniref:Hemerythrin domain-containing protein n=1 Tax=Peredibacter starrii TaxID=28202 RepID=A0AAX4HTP6_9BACT|nr:hemerythrin domain-containing protein [Peredibacter starrii]WPU66567.1 hemerythrin domain-containing protein [Peredibacter starrii]